MLVSRTYLTKSINRSLSLTELLNLQMQLKQINWFLWISSLRIKWSQKFLSITCIWDQNDTWFLYERRSPYDANKPLSTGANRPLIQATRTWIFNFLTKFSVKQNINGCPLTEKHARSRNESNNYFGHIRISNKSCWFIKSFQRPKPGGSTSADQKRICFSVFSKTTKVQDFLSLFWFETLQP